MKFGKIFSLVAMLALVFALTLATGVISGAEEATPAAVEEEITIEFTAPYKECGKIKLSWQSVSGADEYRIYLNDEHVATSLVNYYIKSKLDVADYGQAEILYNFKVEAVDVNGNIIAAGTVDAFGKHVWDNGTVTTAPTCSALGLMTYTCEGCGNNTYTEDIAIDPAAHLYDSGVITTAPNCTEKGVKTFTCQYDGTHTYTEEVDALGHTFVTYVSNNDATCQADGTETATCENCTVTDTRTDEDSKLPHEYFYACDAHCMNCYELTNPAAQHTLTHVDAVAPTCQSLGNVEYYICNDCGTAWDNENATGMPLNRYTVIVPMAPHEYFYACDAHCMNCYELTNPDAQHTATKVDAVAPTCQADGNVEYYVCSICNGHWLDAELTQNSNPRNVVVPKAPHEYFYECDAHCMNCGELTNPDAQHTATKVDAVAPTCQADGNVEYYVCSICNGHWLDAGLTQNSNPRNVVVPKVPHEYFYACDAHCMNCGELTNPDAQHTLTHVEAVAPTCTANGNVEYYICNDCGTAWDNENATGMPLNRYTVIVPMVDHEYNGVVTDPTCTENGYTTYTCTMCTDSYTDDVTSATGHNVGEATKETASAATCTENGLYYDVYYCVDCGVEIQRESQTENALGHNFSDATCTAPKTCTRCSETDGSALGHDYAPATCTEAAKCTRCNQKKGSALGHDLTDATCTEGQTCKVCGLTSNNALGHSFVVDENSDSFKIYEYCQICGEQGELSGYQLPEKYKDIIIKVAVVLGSTIVIVLCVRALRRPATTTPWYKRRRK